MNCPKCHNESSSGLRCVCDALLCPQCYETHLCPPQPAKPHQSRGVAEGFAAERAGKRSICITSPTGGGKRWMIANMATSDDKTSVIFTNRKMITRQTQKEMIRFGAEHSMIAAGYPATLSERVQIASLQTVRRRRGSVYLPRGDRVFIDEGHSKSFHWLVPYYLEQGSTVFLFTATPVGLNKVCDHLVIAGTNSELREIGMLVPCYVYSPDQPSIKGVRKMKIGETYDQAYQKYFSIWQTEIFGNSFAEWKKGNPFARPTLVFAPGVPESRWIVSEFERRGVSAAHIDGETSDDEREDIEGRSRDGKVRVVSSCGVMREGADWGWIYCGIGLQAWVELSTYLQCSGRLLRAYPGKQDCLLIEHAGSFWRHGSPNENRDWQLGCTNISMEKKRFEAYRTGDLPEPIRCPKCNAERKYGPKCHACGHEHTRSVRMIRMSDGTLKKMTGTLTKKKRIVADDQQAWTKAIYASAYSNMTVRQAKGMFSKSMSRWPDASMNLKPWTNDWLDDSRRVRDVWPWLTKRKAKA